MVIEAGSRRREIDAVAGELFHAQGYAATSVRDIARALDIQGASLYAHVDVEGGRPLVDRRSCGDGVRGRRGRGTWPRAPTGMPSIGWRRSSRRTSTSSPRTPSGPASSSPNGATSRSRAREQIAGRRDAYEPRLPSARSSTGSRSGRSDRRTPPSAATFILTALNGIAAWYRPDGRLSARPDRRPLRRPRAPLPLGGPPMTDPLALDPILPPANERACRSTRTSPHDEPAPPLRGARHERRQGRGDRLDARRVPDPGVLRFVEMHANSELMGVLPEREWIMRAPTLRRKLALTAKVQDEVGHAQLLYRVAEDLGKPREAMIAGPARREDEVPQRLPLPDVLVGRHRRHRLARRRGGDRRPAGAPRFELRPVRPDDEEDLLGGVGPHHARPRRRGDDGDRDARPASRRCRRRSTAGGAR